MSDKPFMATPVTADQRCILHASHGPAAPYYTELHHVIPQAWQALWKPEIPRDQSKLWDPRTIPCDPTGHRSVHWLLVKFMKAWAVWIMTDDGQELGQSSGTINQHIKREITSIRSELRKNRAAIRKSVNSNESYWASQAMLRFDEAGGTLKLLTDAHEYGNA